MSGELAVSAPIPELTPTSTSAPTPESSPMSLDPGIPLPGGVTQDSAVVPAVHEDESPPAVTSMDEPLSNGQVEGTPTSDASSDLVRYRVEYVGQDSGSYSADGKVPELDASSEPPVLEYVEVRLSSQSHVSSSTQKTNNLSRTDTGKGRAYINILSPAVAEALRCVVDYFPDLDISGNVIKIEEPYSVFIFFEKELTDYRERADRLAAAGDLSCPNRWASKHIGIVQDFVREKVQKDVDAERARHARGYATFDMLWLLYKPGSDVYYDIYDVAEHEPYVVSSADFEFDNGAISSYDFKMWNINATSHWVGPAEYELTLQHFAGEKSIPSLRVYPCEYLRFADGVTEEDVSQIKQHFLDRGRKWYNLRRKIGCYSLEGVTTTFPRRFVSKAGVKTCVSSLIIDGHSIPALPWWTLCTMSRRETARGHPSLRDWTIHPTH